MYYQWIERDLILNCRIQPKANQDSFAEELDEYLKIRITAPPVDGKANKHLVRFLSKQFKVPQADIEILRGQNNRDKRVLITSPNRLPPELHIAENR